ncbi:MAG: hypothetical protein ACD_46C00691G0002 [uncultured bacterium]|nr:MAG: hypothetical protein ACD_46C00691G0002 [uncultured bacterium]
MVKKILVSAMLASVIGAAHATPVPYVGASVGVLTNTTSNAGNNQAGFYRGMPFNLFAGYGGVINQNIYLAGELTGTVGTGELTARNSGAKSTYGYGFSVIPGVMLSDRTLAFARAGVVRTRFTDVSSTATGGQVGLGLQTSLTQSLDVRGEYDFTAYRSVSSVSAPRSDAATVGLVYKFD